MNLGDGPTAAELDVTLSRAHVIAPPSLVRRHSRTLAHPRVRSPDDPRPWSPEHAEADSDGVQLLVRRPSRRRGHRVLEMPIRTARGSCTPSASRRSCASAISPCWLGWGSRRSATSSGCSARAMSSSVARWGGSSTTGSQMLTSVTCSPTGCATRPRSERDASGVTPSASALHTSHLKIALMRRRARSFCSLISAGGGGDCPGVGLTQGVH